MTKIEALIVGSVTAASCAMIVAKCAGAENPMLIAGLYLLVAGGFTTVRVVRAYTYRKSIWWSPRLTPRRVFMLPFVPFFLSPLFVSCGLVASEWKQNEPSLRHAAIVAGFVLAVPSLLLWIWLCGPTKKSNKSPETNALTQE